MSDADGGASKRKRQRYKAEAVRNRKKRAADDSSTTKSGAEDGLGASSADIGGAGAPKKGERKSSKNGRLKAASLTDVKGGPAFFFMCNAGSEKRTAGQMRDWIEEIVEEMGVSDDEEEDVKQGHDGDGNTEQATEKNQAEKQSKKNPVLDVQQALMAEIESFKTKVPPLQFVNVPTKARALAILKLNKRKVDPVDVVKRILNQCTGISSNRVPSCVRAVPAQMCCHSREQDIKAACEPLLKRYFAAQLEQEMQTFAIQLRRRFCEHLDRDETIKLVADSVAALAPKNAEGKPLVKVDLKKPSFSVVIETCAGLAGISIMDNVEDQWYKLNLEVAAETAN